MTLPNQKYRELVFQILYSKDLVKSEDESAILQMMMTELSVSKKNVRMALDKVNRLIQVQDAIDTMIASASTSYDFDRIQSVTKTILRLALFELFFEQAAPPKVVIAEAIRLSKKFCTLESSKFVNALLDYLYKSSLGDKAEITQLNEQAQELLNSEQAASEAASAAQDPQITFVESMETEDDEHTI